MKFIYLLLALLLLTGCMGKSPFRPTQMPFPSSAVTRMTTEAPTLMPGPTDTKSVLLDIYAWNDAFGDGYIARLPVHELENAPEAEIVRRLIEKWLDHYKTECTDPLYRLQTYSIGEIRLDTDYLGYEIIALAQYAILPAQPLTADYQGDAAPNGYTSLPGETAPDGTLSTGAHFGVFQDGQDYRLRILIGWGT